MLINITNKPNRYGQVGRRIEYTGDMANPAGVGAIVNVGFDRMVKKLEGRDIVSSIQVIGLKGFGPYPVGPVAFAERMRELFVDTTGKST